MSSNQTMVAPKDVVLWCTKMRVIHPVPSVNSKTQYCMEDQSLSVKIANREVDVEVDVEEEAEEEAEDAKVVMEEEAAEDAKVVTLMEVQQQVVNSLSTTFHMIQVGKS